MTCVHFFYSPPPCKSTFHPKSKHFWWDVKNLLPYWFIQLHFSQSTLIINSESVVALAVHFVSTWYDPSHYHVQWVYKIITHPPLPLLYNFIMFFSWDMIQWKALVIKWLRWSKLLIPNRNLYENNRITGEEECSRNIWTTLYIVFCIIASNF